MLACRLPLSPSACRPMRLIIRTAINVCDDGALVTTGGPVHGNGSIMINVGCMADELQCTRLRTLNCGPARGPGCRSPTAGGKVQYRTAKTRIYCAVASAVVLCRGAARPQYSVHRPRARSLSSIPQSQCQSPAWRLCRGGHESTGTSRNRTGTEHGGLVYC
jgi:hypothetical protein